MKRISTLILPLLLVCVSTLACKPDDAAMPDTTGDGTTNPATMNNQITIQVGSRTFTATLLNTATATAFRARLPLTLSMTELNGNEKYGQLSPALPTNPANPGTIQTGDLMLYGASTLVLFYETFRTSYTYTKVGRIDNPAGLVAALGSGNVTVSFASK